MFVNASQLTINPPPLNQSKSLPVLDMASSTASHPVPLLQSNNIPRFMPHSMSNTRMTAIDATTPHQPQIPLAPSTNNAKSMYEWPGPGPRIASLLPPEHLGTPLAGHLTLSDDLGYPQVGAYPYAQQNFWLGGTNQNPDINLVLGSDDKSGNPEMMKRRHVCPVCHKRFNRPSSLNTHMAVHTGAKPFVCQAPDCGRRFSVSSNLRRHEKTHNVRNKEDQENHHTHSSPDHTSMSTPYQSHAQISSMSGYSQSMGDSKHRPSTSYSDIHTSRKHANYPSISHGSTGEYTPYQVYSYPVPQQPGHDRQHQHQNQYQNHLSLPQPIPSASIEFSEFFNAMPPSALGPGINLEDYQVVSGAKSARTTGPASSGEATSHSRSSSTLADIVKTPNNEVSEMVSGEDQDAEGEEDMDVTLEEDR